MLVLTRKTNESIVIGDQIVVTVVEVRGDQVKLGISAPSQVSIHRREVWEEIKKGNIRSTAKPADMERAAGILQSRPAPISASPEPRAEHQPSPPLTKPQPRLVPGNREKGEGR